MTQNQILTTLKKYVYKELPIRMFKIKNITNIINSNDCYTVTGEIINSHKEGWYVSSFDKKWNLLTFEFQI